MISAQANGIHIILDNTVDQDIDISKIYEDGYSTKGRGRGTGLPSLRKILEKYPETSLITEIKSGRLFRKSRYKIVDDGGERYLCSQIYL